MQVPMLMILHILQEFMRKKGYDFSLQCNQNFRKLIFYGKNVNVNDCQPHYSTNHEKDIVANEFS